MCLQSKTEHLSQEACQNNSNHCIRVFLSIRKYFFSNAEVNFCSITVNVFIPSTLISCSAHFTKSRGSQYIHFFTVTGNLCNSALFFLVVVVDGFDSPRISFKVRVSKRLGNVIDLVFVELSYCLLFENTN